MGTANLFSHHAAGTTHDARVPRRTSVFSAALVCLGAAYALSWLEFALAVMIATGNATATPIAAMVASRILIGGLYLCVALRLLWARWLTVTLGLAAVILVGPMLGAEWRAFPVAAVVTGATLVCKLAASLFLVSPALSHETK
jgi:hypothetical protein